MLDDRPNTAIVLVGNDDPPDDDGAQAGFIDSCNLIVRFNRARDYAGGGMTGTKTDVVVISCRGEKGAALAERNPRIAKTADILWLVGDHYEAAWLSKYERSKVIERNILRWADADALEYLSPAKPSCGLAALWYCNAVMNGSEIFVARFGFGQLRREQPDSLHDWRKEVEIINRMKVTQI